MGRVVEAELGVVGAGSCIRLDQTELYPVGSVLTLKHPTIFEVVLSGRALLIWALAQTREERHRLPGNKSRAVVGAQITSTVELPIGTQLEAIMNPNTLEKQDAIEQNILRIIGCPGQEYLIGQVMVVGSTIALEAFDRV